MKVGKCLPSKWKRKIVKKINGEALKKSGRKKRENGALVKRR